MFSFLIALYGTFLLVIGITNVTQLGGKNHYPKLLFSADFLAMLQIVCVYVHGACLCGCVRVCKCVCVHLGILHKCQFLTFETIWIDRRLVWDAQISCSVAVMRKVVRRKFITGNQRNWSFIGCSSMGN